MQNSQIIDITSGNASNHHIGTDSLNGNRLNDRGGFVTAATGANGNKYILEQIDASQLADEDSDSDDGVSGGVGMYGKMVPGGNGPKPGKKTKGRVKIKMEFIENKLRRYTTFSKRKTGIMKKAYELSTLTGTQVMLLVASETGHVYTFATRKLQPMITSESGKALIQTCLNSPEAPPGSQMSMEQRMNPSGFEETELTYGIGEDDGKVMGEGNSSMFPGMTDNNHNITLSAPSTTSPSSISQQSPQLPQPLSQSTTNINREATSPKTTVSMQPSTNIIFQSGTPMIPIPTPSSLTSSTPSTPQTLYRFQQSNSLLPLNTASTNSTAPENTATVQSVSLSTPSLITGSSSNTNSNNNNNTAVTPSILMYQTPNGIVYATPTDRIFNYQQPATALSVAQPESTTTMSGGQIIAIPVPVSLPNSAQMIQLAAPPQSHQTQQMEAGEISHQQPPPNKKQRK